MVRKSSDVNNDSSDTFTADLDGQVNGGKFLTVFKIENFKMICSTMTLKSLPKESQDFPPLIRNTGLLLKHPSTYGG